MNEEINRWERRGRNLARQINIDKQVGRYINGQTDMQVDRRRHMDTDKYGQTLVKSTTTNMNMQQVVRQ